MPQSRQLESGGRRAAHGAYSLPYRRRDKRQSHSRWNHHSGGDPFYNPFALLALLRRLKEETHKNVWCYTGYTYESLLKDETRRPCLDYIDTLVDGPFVQSLFDPALSFRGSSNQRILHLSKYR